MAHFDVLFYILPDVERTALLYKDCFEIRPLKCIFTYLLECAGERDLFDSTVIETIFPDVLNSVRNFDTFEILAVLKCLFLDPLHSGRNSDALYRSLAKNFSFVFQPIVNLFRPQPL